MLGSESQENEQVIVLHRFQTCPCRCGLVMECGCWGIRWSEKHEMISALQVMQQVSSDRKSALGAKSGSSVEVKMGGIVK